MLHVLIFPSPSLFAPSFLTPLSLVPLSLVPFTLAPLYLFFPFLLTGNNLTCLSNQNYITDYIRINSTWGQCVLGSGAGGVCYASWEKSPTNGTIVIIYKCLNGFFQYQCPPGGGLFSRGGLTSQSPIIAVCCYTNYCNTPEYLMSFVNELGECTSIGVGFCLVCMA